MVLGRLLFFHEGLSILLCVTSRSDMVITHENALGQVLYQNSVLPMAITLGGHLLLVTALPHEKEKEKPIQKMCRYNQN